MRKLQHILKLLVFSSVILMAAACETIFEGEQDCSTKIKFELRKHRQALQTVNGKPADVFDSAVGSVHLFIYNAANGKLVFEKYAKTENLKTEAELGIGSGNSRSYMAIDLDPGTYRIVAWCGLGENDENNAFALSETSRAAAAPNWKQCSVKLSAPGLPVADEKYETLFHGTVSQVTLKRNGEVVPVQLTKNTNDIAVMVQHLETTLVAEDYDIVYTDANGSMSFDDNSMTSDERLEYFQHTKSVLQNDATEFNGEVVQTGSIIAHISTARLLAAHKNNARLEVRNRKGETIFSVPLIQYLLEIQPFTSDGQYYLDCEDTYNCSFFLTGEYERWAPAMIIINNWVKVPDQVGDIGGE